MALFFIAFLLSSVVVGVSRVSGNRPLFSVGDSENIGITMNLYDMDDPYNDAICNEAMDAFEEAQRGAGFKFDLIPHTGKRARKLESSTRLHHPPQRYRRFGFDSVSVSSITVSHQ